MSRRYLKLFLVCSLVSSFQVMADGLVFSDAWARATVPNASSAAIYGSLKNDSDQPLTIKKITTNVAGMVMLHRSSLENDMMKMSAVEQLSLSPGEVAKLEPGGLHMMLMKLREPLNENQIFYIDILTSAENNSRAEVLVGSIGQMSSPR